MVVKEVIKEVEKIIRQPFEVLKVVEKIVEKPVISEKIIEVVKILEKPITVEVEKIIVVE